MPRIVNLGSVNIDHVYAVPHFVRPGETLASESYRRFPGGKGFNQSVALARAGAVVVHCGRVGADGAWLRDLLAAEGADVSALEATELPTGHAIIQVAPGGQNAIVLHGAANLSITPADGERMVAACRPGDILLLQNEISALPAILAAAGRRALPVVFNPAPMTAAVAGYPLEHVRLLVVNEVEGAQLAGEQPPREMLAALRRRFPRACVLLTMGSRGAMAADAEGTAATPSFPVRALDTTAAGDTFTGYFLAARAAGATLAAALRRASAAAAICCTRPGAAASIPRREEVDAFLARHG